MQEFIGIVVISPRRQYEMIRFLFSCVMMGPVPK